MGFNQQTVEILSYIFAGGVGLVFIWMMVVLVVQTTRRTIEERSGLIKDLSTEEVKSLILAKYEDVEIRHISGDGPLCVRLLKKE